MYRNKSGVCKQKIKYKNIPSAYKAKTEILRKKKLITQVYKCTKCGFFHLGKPGIKQDPLLFWKNMDHIIEEHNKTLFKLGDISK